VDGFRPHIIICDIEMLPTGGIEFVEKLHGHADPALRGTPVIMLTADRNEATIQTAARLRLAGYLVKPVSSKQLTDLVRTALKRLGLGDIPSTASRMGSGSITPAARRPPGQS
jgi:DNA-binding NarL/FixJ family response regulator